MTSTLPHTNMANAIRALAMDAVQKANSGHPGMPMGMAEIAVALWSGHYSHNPANPKWVNRDRFLLSNGHGSMLQRAVAYGQRLWKAQPGGGFSGLGSSPTILIFGLLGSG